MSSTAFVHATSFSFTFQNTTIFFFLKEVVYRHNDLALNHNLVTLNQQQQGSGGCEGKDVPFLAKLEAQFALQIDSRSTETTKFYQSSQELNLKYEFL